MSIVTGQTSKQAPQSDDAYGSEALSVDPGELRREHRADRARVDRAVGVPAGALVDRADVEAGRAADAVQRLPARPRRRAPRVRPLSSSTRWNSCGPSPGVTPVHIEVYGFIRSPVDDRGSSCRNTSRSRQVGTSFSMPMTVIRVSRQGQAHPAVALGLDHGQRAGLGDGEVGPGDRHLRAEERLAAGAPGRHGQRRAARRSAPGPTPGISRRKISRISARLRWIAGTRMCDGPVVARAARSARPGRSRPAAMPAASSASLSPISWVAIDLTLTTSVGAGGPDQVGDDPVGLVGVARPSARCRRAR